MNKLQQLDLNLCISCNRISSYWLFSRFFSLVSRLGDGVFWYSLMLVLPLIYGIQGLLISFHMISAAIPALIIYKFLKQKTLRPRPCAVSPVVKQQTHTLDQFSFPSGHTLHAVCFTLIVSGHLPLAIWILTPFTLMVVISRPILGLHYPSDVLAGAFIGASIALLSWNIPLFSMIAADVAI
jgi:undecaprenyl-diphosphatase